MYLAAAWYQFLFFISLLMNLLCLAVPCFLNPTVFCLTETVIVVTWIRVTTSSTQTQLELKVLGALRW